MNTPKHLLSLLVIIMLQASLKAQVQWYQNQDGNTPPPSGTVGTSINRLTQSSFIACYQWSSNIDQYTWKISKSHINGNEQKKLFFTGTMSMVQVRPGLRNIIYVLKNDYPLGQNPVYTLYKLDTNLNIKSQKNIEFPNQFSIFNMNAFVVDGSDNVYFAGDGQYPDEFGLGFYPASFVMKIDKNLSTKWSKMDSTQTSYTRLHVDTKGNVIVIADFYTSFPDIFIKKYKSSGQLILNKKVTTDAGRFSLFSTLDDDDNLLLYGGKFTDNSQQAMYIYKVTKNNCSPSFNKTYFGSVATQLYDLKMDTNGDIYCLVSQYFDENNQVSRISKISSNTGRMQWTKAMKFSQDSCNLFKIVMSEGDKFYVVGEKKYQNLFSRGFAMRMKKNSQSDGFYPAPDSVRFQRSHWLSDGITDKNKQLISIGSTNDLDTLTYASTYYRAFAIKFGNNTNNNHNHNHHNNDDCYDNNRSQSVTASTMVAEQQTIIINSKPAIFPNPVQSMLTVANLAQDEFNRLAVYNLQGSVVMQQAFSGTNARVNVSNLPGGTYMLVLRSTTSEKQMNMKFVIRR